MKGHLALLMALLLCAFTAAGGQEMRLVADLTVAMPSGAHVRRLMVDPSGRMYVITSDSVGDRFTISLFAPTGVLLRQYGTGSRDDLPLREIVGAGLLDANPWVADGRKTVWVLDPAGRRRIAVLDSIDLEAGRRPVTTIDRVLSDHTALVTAISSNRDAKNPLAVTLSLFHVATSGKVLHRLADEPLEYLNAVVGTADGWLPTAIPTLDFFASSQDGTLVAQVRPAFAGPDSGRTRVALRKAHGQLVYEVAVPFHAEPLTPAAVDSTLRARHTRIEAVPYYQSAAPPVQQPFKAAMVANDGRVMLAFRSDSSRRELLLLSASGAVEAHHVIPSGEDLLRMDGNSLWVRRLAPEGEAIVRYRVGVPR